MSEWKKVGGLLVLLCWSASLSAQLMPERLSPQEQYAYYFNQAAQAYNAGNDADWVAATEKLHALRPFNQDFMTHLVQGYARLGNKSKAFDMMLRMQQQGLAEDWSSYEELADLRQHSLYDHLSNLMSKAGEPFGEAEEYAVVPSTIPMPEAMALDAETDRLFVGTIRDGEIRVKSDDQQAWSVFADRDSVADLRAVFALGIDSPRDVLWVATGMTSQYQRFEREAFGEAALIKLDLDTGEHLATYPVASADQDHLLGALTVASDGTVYATDSLLPVVYRLGPKAEGLELFFGSPMLSSLRGLALDEDKQKLYVADHETGIIVLDTSDREQAWSLAIPETLNLGGIDGLYLSGQHLVVIQNGISPNRILRLELGDDGLGVLAVAPVVAALPEFDGPTYGAMHDQTLYFFANSHWQYVDSRGQPNQEPLPDVHILSTNINNPEVQVVGEEILRQLQQQQQGN